MGCSHSIYVAAWTNHNFFNLSLFSSEKILKTFEILKYITNIQEISTVIIVFGSVPSVGLWRRMNLLCCSPMAVLKNSCWSPSFIGLSSDNLSISGLGQQNTWSFPTWYLSFLVEKTFALFQVDSWALTMLSPRLGWIDPAIEHCWFIYTNISHCINQQLGENTVQTPFCTRKELLSQRLKPLLPPQCGTKVAPFLSSCQNNGTQGHAGSSTTALRGTASVAVAVTSCAQCCDKRETIQQTFFVPVQNSSTNSTGAYHLQQQCT